MKMQNNTHIYEMTFDDGEIVIVRGVSILSATQQAIKIKSETPELYDTKNLKVIQSKEV